MRLTNIFSLILSPIFLTKTRLREAIESTIKPFVISGITCLDVGCGDRPYEHLFSGGSYTGIDIKESGRILGIKRPDLFYDGKIIPFEENTFDLIISTQVLEHVPDPLGMLKEMARVCKPGGGVLISVPFVYPEHEEPFDYFRFTRFGIADLLAKAGLKTETMVRDSSAVETIAILINVYLLHNLLPKIRGMSRVFTILACFPIQVFAILLSKIVPDSRQLYLNLVVYSKKAAS